MKESNKVKMWWWITVILCLIFIPLDVYWMNTSKIGFIYIPFLSVKLYIFIDMLNDHYSKYDYLFEGEE